MAGRSEMVEEYVVTATLDATVDSNLRAAGFSGSMITPLRKELGRILLKRADGAEKAVFATTKASVGDVIRVFLPVSPVLYPSSDLKPVFVYEDKDIAVVDKPHGIASVPVKSHFKDSLASILGSVWGEFVYRPVGRLDKDTSGLIIVARNTLCANRLHQMQLYGKIEKFYTALVEGIMPESGEIDAPIALSSDGIRREVSSSGKSAKTLFTRIGISDHRSLVRFRLLTGRTHQIRVHSAYIGHPLAGDSLYNPAAYCEERLMLHCSRLSFPHPVTGKLIDCESTPPFSLF